MESADIRLVIAGSGTHPWWMYLLRVPCTDNHLPTYKYGITSNLYTRLSTHRRNLKFTRIVNIRGFATENHVREVEKLVARYAELSGERQNIWGNTEIICTGDIGRYVEMINSVYPIPVPASSTLTRLVYSVVPAWAIAVGLFQQLGRFSRLVWKDTTLPLVESTLVEPVPDEHTLVESALDEHTLIESALESTPPIDNHICTRCLNSHDTEQLLEAHQTTPCKQRIACPCGKKFYISGFSSHRRSCLVAKESKEATTK